jgi:hypothetical protein
MLEEQKHDSFKNKKLLYLQLEFCHPGKREREINVRDRDAMDIDTYHTTEFGF